MCERWWGEAVSGGHGRKEGTGFLLCARNKMKMESARILEGGDKRYKFIWKGCKQGTSGVGILVAEKWIEKVAQIKKISERLML